MWTAAPSASCGPAWTVVLPCVHERKQFGQPTGELQLMQARIADMRTVANAARAHVHAVAKACDRAHHVRAGARLAHRQRADMLARDQLRQVASCRFGKLVTYPARALAATV